MSKKNEAQQARACQSVEIEDEHGAAVVVKETPNRDRLLIYTKPAKRGGDNRVFLTLDQLQHLTYVAKYELDLIAAEPEQVINLDDADPIVEAAPQKEEEAF